MGLIDDLGLDDPLASVGQQRSGGTAALIVASALPRVYVDQGIFEFDILTPDEELWSPEAAVDFLERFVAW